ncbi:gustatory receptor for sugar taste 64f-like isoform X2 [Plodia interpunctella]|uniref:gustatory receptor for sugar taste 64f-like isoform X2 n=1 Tax=Plodia interpunctella TaxID=58824 RepID=UPI0023683F33|nr:gustatory receptor for sugar taste 64f-like isoform X1 [Plodia interpunctella]
MRIIKQFLLIFGNKHFSKMLAFFAKLGNLEDRLGVTKYDQHGLHSSTRKALLTGRILGLLPLCGLSNSDSSQLRFTLLSPYTILYVASLAGQIIMCFTSIYWLMKNKATLTNVTNSLFYSLSLISILILTNIGRTWPKLMAKVEEIEKTLPPFKRNIPFFCNITMSLMLISGLIEHILSVIYGYTVAKSCQSTNVTEMFFHFDKPWIFNYTNYTLWKGVLVEIFNMQATFTWTYNDILIMVISIYLAEHFVMHNELLKIASKQEHFSCDEFRIQYLQIVRLVKLINNQVGIYILACFGSNLYWICTQLFYSLNKNQTGHFIACTPKNLEVPEYKSVYSIEHIVYFTYSFSFLMARTLLVLMLAARVHSTSIVPLSFLYEIPTDKFNVELLRTIVTYELVLLQFNK